MWKFCHISLSSFALLSENSLIFDKSPEIKL